MISTVNPSVRVPSTILVADDERSVRLVARVALERAGHRVLVAEDGLDAIALFEAHQGAFDLVVLDVSMPRMSGREAYDRLVALDPAVRVMFSSGFSRDEAGEAFDALPIAGWLHKPFRADALVVACEAALQR